MKCARVFLYKWKLFRMYRRAAQKYKSVPANTYGRSGLASAANPHLYSLPRVVGSKCYIDLQIERDRLKERCEVLENQIGRIAEEVEWKQ